MKNWNFRARCPDCPDVPGSRMVEKSCDVTIAGMRIHSDIIMEECKSCGGTGYLLRER